MQTFALAILLITPVLSITLSYDNYTLTLTTTNSLNLNHLATSDACLQLAVDNTSIYHLSNEQAVKIWSVTNPAISSNIYFPLNSTSIISQFSMSPA